MMHWKYIQPQDGVVVEGTSPEQCLGLGAVPGVARPVGVCRHFARCSSPGAGAEENPEISMADMAVLEDISVIGRLL